MKGFKIRVNSSFTLVLMFFVSAFIGWCSTNTPKLEADTRGSQSLVDYALSWVDNRDIPYVWGGGRGEGVTLESLSADTSAGAGTDFQGLLHFGISTPAYTGGLGAMAKKVMYNQSEATLGDLCS